MSLIIYGASDDLVEIEGSVREELPAYDTDGVSITIRNPARLVHPGGVIVRMRHMGTWEATVGLLDEGVPIPWPVTISNAVDRDDFYTVRVEIQCPIDATVEWGFWHDEGVGG